jgi:CubicO group peptidase (beta-lactamase class C family)
MTQAKMKSALDAVLKQTVERHGGVPGVVAMATDRHDNFYEGAVGTRELGKDSPMTTDSVFAIFSTTKALAGVCMMQLVEEGKISLSAGSRRLRRQRPTQNPASETKDHGQRPDAPYLGLVLRIL